MTEHELRQPVPAESNGVMWSTVVKSEASMSGARSEASAALQLAGCGRQLIDDINLIVTELTVNALRHGSAPRVMIDIGRGAGDSVVVTVAHDEDVDRFRVADPPVMADTDQMAGRGRAIVAALSGRFETRRRPPSRIEHVAIVSD